MSERYIRTRSSCRKMDAVMVSCIIITPSLNPSNSLPYPSWVSNWRPSSRRKTTSPMKQCKFDSYKQDSLRQRHDWSSSSAIAGWSPVWHPMFAGKWQVHFSPSLHVLTRNGFVQARIVYSDRCNISSLLYRSTRLLIFLVKEDLIL